MMRVLRWVSVCSDLNNNKGRRNKSVYVNVFNKLLFCVPDSSWGLFYNEKPTHTGVRLSTYWCEAMAICTHTGVETQHTYWCEVLWSWYTGTHWNSMALCCSMQQLYFGLNKWSSFVNNDVWLLFVLHGSKSSGKNSNEQNPNYRSARAQLLNGGGAPWVNELASNNIVGEKGVCVA